MPSRYLITRCLQEYREENTRDTLIARNTISRWMCERHPELEGVSRVWLHQQITRILSEAGVQRTNLSAHPNPTYRWPPGVMP